jgi:hypothetical protein
MPLLILPRGGKKQPAGQEEKGQVEITRLLPTRVLRIECVQFLCTAHQSCCCLVCARLFPPGFAVQSLYSMPVSVLFNRLFVIICQLLNVLGKQLKIEHTFLL